MGIYDMFADYARRNGLDKATSMLALDLGADQVQGLRIQYEADLQKVQVGGPAIIAATAENWYPGPGHNSMYWGALESTYRELGWPTSRIASLDDASNKVVAHTPRPDRLTFGAKGLVVGYVQSGKTTNFTAVIAKMVDVDYQFVLVLSGIHNGLRRQTQKRLDEQLSGLNPSKWTKLTSELSDFTAPFSPPSAQFNGDGRVLAIVKKNATVLRRLIKWLDTDDGRRTMKTKRVIIVDDEADQASVATTQINPLIRKLLTLMPRSTYIGYTATPFANVFIDPTANDDLYPRDFILNLPQPDGYFGPEMIFGRDEVEGETTAAAPDGYDMVRIVKDEDAQELQPKAKAPASDFAPRLTHDLLDAVRWFWLATAARRFRGDHWHSTMLLHTSVKIDVQEAFRAPLEEFRDRSLADLQSGEATAWDVWRDLWEVESRKVSSSDFGRVQNTWREVASQLEQAIADTTVILDNYRSQDRLVYNDNEPVTAIAIGGNTLSRGLTLEGLVVSFFVRAASAYDTLLQMGRWFGFRTGYEDLPRLWMTESLASAFRHLASVEHDMRRDIEHYQTQDLSPIDVAVRIRTHPSLRITAKMGAASPTYVSFAGRRMQTRYFKTQDRDWLGQNLDAGRELIRTASAAGRDDQREDSYRLWRDVPVSAVVQFFAKYNVHPDSPDIDPLLLNKYIEGQLGGDEGALRLWSVALATGDEAGGNELVDLGGTVVPAVTRSKLRQGDQVDRADIKTLMSKQDRALDLGITMTDAKAKSETDLINLRNSDEENSHRGLLVLYPIDRVSAPARAGNEQRAPLDAVDTTLGFGVVFPGDAQTKNQVFSTYMAVDLSGVETTDLSEALEEDAEGQPQ